MYLVSAISYVYGEEIHDNHNESLLNKFSINNNFIKSKIGVNKRHSSKKQDSSFDLGLKSFLKLEKDYNISKDKIDLLVVVTQNPGSTIPHISTLIHRSMNLNKFCITFDISLGCTGYAQAIPILVSYMKNFNLNKSVLITSDQYSKIINYDDKSTSLLFSDAASATLIEKSSRGFEVIDNYFITDSSYSDSINNYKNNHLVMKGWEVVKFLEENIEDCITGLLKRNQIPISKISYFVFHQGSRYILNLLKKKFKIDDSKIIDDLSESGNTVSSTIPIALKNQVFGKIINNQYVLTCGFGIGLSISANLLRYTDE